VKISVLEFHRIFNIRVFEGEFYLIGVRNDPSVEIKRKQGKNKRGYEVGKEKPAKADTAVQDRDDLGIGRHASREVDDGNENKERREQIGKVGYEVEVIVNNDASQRSLPLNEIIKFFTDIKNDGNDNDQCKGKEKCPQKLSDDIPVKNFHVRLRFLRVF
jgi:hypothetical protein